MGDAGHGCTQADQEHEGQHQVAAGRVTGACLHRATSCHTAAVGVENLRGRREESLGTSRSKQLVQGTSQLGTADWRLGFPMPSLSQDGLSSLAVTWRQAVCTHWAEPMLRLWGEKEGEEKKRREA